MKQRIKLQNKKTIALSVLVAASTGIAYEAYVPYPNMQKNPVYNQTQFKQAVGDIYLRDVPRTYGRPMTVWVNGMSTYGHVGPKAYSYSEERKQSIQQILQNIRTIRSEIRTKANAVQNANAAYKMLETIACTMENRTRNRDHQLKLERSQELHTHTRLISTDILRKRKGMPVIDLSDIA